jgi:hypothetical protein
VSDIASIPGKAPLRLAGEWESWLKSKDSLAAGFDMNTLVGWMQRWVADLVSLRLGGPVRFFPAEHDILHGLAGRMTIDSALGCYNEINQTRRVAQHPLNARLFLEDMLLRYARGFARSAPQRCANERFPQAPGPVAAECPVAEHHVQVGALRGLHAVHQERRDLRAVHPRVQAG